MSVETEKAVELFVRRDDAARFPDEVQADDPELAERRGSVNRRLPRVAAPDACDWYRKTWRWKRPAARLTRRTARASPRSPSTSTAEARDRIRHRLEREAPAQPTR